MVTKRLSVGKAAKTQVDPEQSRRFIEAARGRPFHWL